MIRQSLLELELLTDSGGNLTDSSFVDLVILLASLADDGIDFLLLHLIDLGYDKENEGG